MRIVALLIIKSYPKGEPEASTDKASEGEVVVVLLRNLSNTLFILSNIIQ